MNQPTVVIVSDDPEFCSAISSRWQQGRGTPAFTQVGGDLCSGLATEAFDLAIVGDVRAGLQPKVLEALEQSGKPVVLVHDETAANLAEANPRLVLLQKQDAWVEMLILLAAEILRRSDALARLRRAELANTVLERQAALGRYVIEMRHNLNNALTSILGNAELLLLEPNLPTVKPQSQLETIRNMALRMNEILQRFSSLEKELNVAARQNDTESKVRAQVAGW